MIGGLAAAALVAIYALAGFFALPRWLASTASERVQAALGRPLSLGEVAFNPFTLTLTVREAVLPDADGGPLAGFRRLEVNASLASIWRRGVVLESIAIDAPVVRAVLRPDGTLNLADLARLAPPDEPAPSPPPPAAPLRLAIGELTIGAGELAFVDRRRDRPFEARLTPVDFTLRAFSTFETRDNAWHFDARSAAGETVAFDGAVFLAPLRSRGTFALGAVKAATLASYLGDALPFELADGELALRGGFDVDTADGATQLAVNLQSLDVDRLRLKARGAADDTVQLDRIELRDGAADLVARQVRLGSLQVTGGRVALWREASGLTSIDALLGIGTASAADPTNGGGAVDGPAPGASSPVWRFDLAKAGVQQLAVSFEDRSLANRPRIELASVSVEAASLSSDLARPVDARLKVEVASGGTLDVDARVQPDSLETQGKLRLAELDLRPSQPWLARATQITLQGGRASAELAFDRDARGVMNASGTFGVTDFATRDGALKQDFVKWKRLRLDGLSWRSEPMRLRIRDVVAEAPYARVVISPERHLNLATLLSPPGTPPPASRDEDDEGSEAASTVSGTTRPARGPAADVAVERVRIDGGSAHFADLWIKPNFSVALQDLAGTVRGLSSRDDTRAVVDIKGTVDRYAPVTISGEVNPLAAEVYSDLHMDFRNLEMTTATPYSGHFAGYKIEKGKLNVDLNYRIDHRRIDATNKFVIDQLQLGEKVDSPDATSLPVRLAIALLKDRNGVIDIDLPVTGSLDDPKFRVGPLIWKAFVNLIVKAATAPFALLGSLFGGGDEVNQLLFVPGDATLDETARSRLAALRKGLIERPGLSLEIPAGWSEGDRAALVEAELPAAVEAAWELHKKQQKLKADAAATPEQLEALREQVRPTVVVTDDTLVALGRSRASAIQDALLAEGEIDPARVFVINVPPLALQADRVRMDLTLK